MFRPLCFILLISLCWPKSSARHLVSSSSNYRGLQHQQPYYLPYSDYGYTYSGPPPYPAPYNQHFQQPYHSPMYSPPGTYYDQRRGILRPFPGGGVPVLVDYHKRCSNHYVGLKAHPDQKEYYYVCKPDCVIFGKCQNLQIFNNATGQCIQHPKPEYIPTCSTAGRFPLFSDCHLYYKCEEDLQPKIYSCPAYMIFSPVSKKCISGNKCIPTKISPQSSYMPEYCATKFPPCYENGTFRSPSDCSLYYKCDLQKDVVYVQTRFRCPSGQFYDLEKQECLPSQQVACDCIQVAELVYPKNHNIPFQPPVFPAQFNFDSLEENLYPIEESQEELFKNCEEIEASNIIEPEDPTTTLEPEVIGTTLVEELKEKDDSAVQILSDYVDMDEGKSASEEQPPTTTDSSEENTGFTEGSGNTEADSEEFSTPNLEESNSAVTEEDESVKEDITTENEIDSEEITDEPEALKEEPEIQTEKPLEEETTTTSSTLQTELCKNEDVNGNSLATDISDTHSQTQTHTCLPNLTTTTTTPNSDTDQTTNTNIHETDFTRGSRSTIHDHKQTILTKQNPTITTQLPTTTITSTNTDHILEELTEKNNINDDLENNLLDTETSLETAETTRSSEKTTPVIQKTTQRPFEEEKQVGEEEEEEENENLLDSKHLEEEEGKELKEEEEEENEKEQETFSTENKILEEMTTPKEEPKHIEETSLSHITEQESTTPPPPSTLIQTSTITNTTSKPPATETTDLNWDLTMDDDDMGLEDTKITLDDFESTTLMPEEELENLFPSHNQENKTLDEKLVTLRAADFENEELLPVHSKSNILNELSTHTTDFDYITDQFDQDITNFIDDYTTISNDQETTSTPSTNEDQTQTLITQHSTALKRRETSTNEITLPPSTTTETPTPSNDLETQTTTPLPEFDDSNANDLDSYEDDDIGVLDSEVVLPSVEVSNNEITSAETSTAKQQQFPSTHSTTITTTQTPTTTPQYTNINTTTTTATTEPCRKHLDSIDLHVRNDSPSLSDTDSNTDSPSSPKSKSLYYILKSKPVINNFNNKSENETVAAPNCLDNENEHIPRLEIIAERPIDVHFSICPSTCDKDHKHKFTPSSNRAVFLRWFSNKSKQTIGFETVNDVDDSVQVKDC